MAYIKKLKDNELIGGTDNTDVYPVTSTEAVYNRENVSQEYINNHVDGSKIVDGTVTTSKIANNAVTMGKLDNEVQTEIQRGTQRAWNPKGTYNENTVYGVNDLVYHTDANSSYISLQANNQGHNPAWQSATGEWWMKVVDGSYVNVMVEELEQAIAQAIEDAQEDISELISDSQATIDAAVSGANSAAQSANTAAANAEAKIDWVEEQVDSLTAYEVATALDETSIIPVQNKVVAEKINKIYGGKRVLTAYNVRAGYWNSSLEFVSSTSNNQKCGIIDVVGGNTYYTKYRNDGSRYTIFVDANGNKIGNNITSSSASSEKELFAPLNASKLYISNVYDSVSTLYARYYEPQLYAPLSLKDSVDYNSLILKVERDNISKLYQNALSGSAGAYDVQNFVYDSSLYELLLTRVASLLYKNGVLIWSTTTAYNGAYVDEEHIYLFTLSNSNVSYRVLDITTGDLTSSTALITGTGVSGANTCRLINYSGTVYMTLSILGNITASIEPPLYSINFGESSAALIGKVTAGEYQVPSLGLQNGILYMIIPTRYDKIVYQYDGEDFKIANKATNLIARQDYHTCMTVFNIKNTCYVLEENLIYKMLFDDSPSTTAIFNISSFVDNETYTHPYCTAICDDGNVLYFTFLSCISYSANSIKKFTYCVRKNWIDALFKNNGTWKGTVDKISDLAVGETGIVPFSSTLAQVSTGSGTGERIWYYSWGVKDLMRVTKTNSGTKNLVVSPFSCGNCRHDYTPFKADKHLNSCQTASYRGSGMSKYGNTIWMGVTANPTGMGQDRAYLYAEICRTLNGGISFISRCNALIPETTNEGTTDCICAVDGGTPHAGRLWIFGDRLINISGSFESDIYGIIAQYSDNNGTTWSDVVDIHEIIVGNVDTTDLVDDRIATTGGITLSNGTLVIMAELHYSNKFVPFPLYTTDGVNWQVGAVCNTESAETQHIEKDGYLYITTRANTNVRSGWNDGTRKFWRIPINELSTGTWEQVVGLPPVSYANSVTVGFGYCNGVWLMSCPTKVSRNNITLFKSSDLINWSKVVQLTNTNKNASNLAGYSSIIFEKDILRVSLESQYYDVQMIDLDYLLPYIFS